MKNIKVIFGLGNPGKKYFFSRHNLGSFFVQQLAELNEVKLIEKKRF
ncbi:hypothetical protein RJV14_00765 [Buchnera aphidicola (Kurisakia onigurumii)]